MAPIAISPDDSHRTSFDAESVKHRNSQPLKKTGAIDDASRFPHVELTPAIGREYAQTNIVDELLNASDADELLRDLAITISERGVVFFRAQSNLTNELQKQLILRLGSLTSRPASSTLHIHPLLNSTNEFGVPDDNEISTISSLARKKFFVDKTQQPRQSNTKYDAAAWHSDIQFEHNPADYTSLRLTQLPATGGDTLWASGYDILDRFSRPYQKFLERLTATYVGDGFLKAEREGRAKLFKGERGSPANAGGELASVHPLVRTNPVTGWKSLFSVGTFPKWINELNEEESEELLKKFKGVLQENHDLQVRFKWKAENDIAIWDNRSVFHAATFDYEGLGERFGNRVVGIGEKPYLDPNSLTKAEAFAAGTKLPVRG